MRIFQINIRLQMNFRFELKKKRKEKFLIKYLLVKIKDALVDKHVYFWLNDFFEV